MWRNYLTVGIRSLAKSRTYSIINIAGLAIGMAACLMILLFIRYELSYDKWLPDVENTYQLQSLVCESGETGEEFYLQMSPYIAKASASQKDFPQVERAVYVQDNEPVLPERWPSHGHQELGCSRTTTSSKSVSLPLARGRRTASSQLQDRGDHAGRGDQAAMEPTMSSVAR